MKKILVTIVALIAIALTACAGPEIERKGDVAEFPVMVPASAEWDVPDLVEIPAVAPAPVFQADPAVAAWEAFDASGVAETFTEETRVEFVETVKDTHVFEVSPVEAVEEAPAVEYVEAVCDPTAVHEQGSPCYIGSEK